MESLIENETNELIPAINRISHAQEWKYISSTNLSTKAQDIAYRLNGLGSSFYFIKVILRKHRLSNNFHRNYCSQFECEHLNEVFEVPRDHFKAIDINTLVPTTLGFKLMKDIHVGDNLFTLNGSISKVIGESEIFFNRPCSKVIFSTGEEVITDNEHLWLTDVRKLRSNKNLKFAPQISTTENIAKTLIYANKLDIKTGNYYPEYNHRVPVAQSIELNESYGLIIHPYAYGVWLGDGDTNGAGFTSENDEIPSLCRLFGEQINKHSTYQRYGFVNDFIARLRILDVLGNKYISDIYFNSCKEQRLFLFQGLMDTDGSISKEGQCSFTNTNKLLVNQTRTLAASLGYKPSPIGTYKAMINGKCDYGDFYVFTFYASPDNSPFLLKRKVNRLRKLKNTNSRQIIAVEPCESVPVKCIKIDHPIELYLITESYIPTHNTTIGAEGMPIWWALPFTQQDEYWMRKLGYGDEWIKWMHIAHDQNTRTLIAMEVIKNAWKVGKKISNHYKKNDLFRNLYSEIIPDNTCQWSLDTMTHMRDFTRGDANQGEGTFELTGVDAALQSKHYRRLVFDDLFGKDALRSEVVAESTWDWFKLAAGAFDSVPDNPDELPDLIVNGNRWSYKDLNFKIRKELPFFRFHTHDAEGGCCPMHPPGVPIFPEEFSMKKLARLKEWFGEYFYSCQFRNRPIPPGGNKFKSEWLKYFVFKTENIGYAKEPNEMDLSWQTKKAYETGLGFQTLGDKEEKSYRRHNVIRHEVALGVSEKDVPTSQLYKMTIVDPNHAGEKGRARNGVLTLGIRKNPFYIYVFEIYANNSSREDTIQEIYRQGEKWRSKNLFIEIAAGQTWLKTHFDIMNDIRTRDGKFTFSTINSFKDNRSENAKDDRIEDMEPAFRRGQVWLNQLDPNLSKFKEEYEEYPHCATKDILDVLALAIQNIDIDFIDDSEDLNVVMYSQQKIFSRGRNSITGY